MQVGQRVHLRFSPGAWGTVSAIRPGGFFRVTWHTPDHGRKNPRMRVWYTRDALVTGIKAGTPEA